MSNFYLNKKNEDDKRVFFKKKNLILTIKKKKREYDEQTKENIKREENKKRAISMQKIDKLSKPKERLKVGKALLQMKKMFPEDKILRNMILQEFKKNTMVKDAGEYDVFDSEEEDKIKGRNEITPKIIGKRIPLSELEKPGKMKENELAQLFSHELDTFYNDKMITLNKNQENQKEMVLQDRKLNRAICKAANTFIEQRKKRFEEKVLTINEFLISLYNEIKIDHEKAVKRKFPHLKYGESKKFKSSFFISF